MLSEGLVSMTAISKRFYSLGYPHRRLFFYFVVITFTGYFILNQHFDVGKFIYFPLQQESLPSRLNSSEFDPDNPCKIWLSREDLRDAITNARMSKQTLQRLALEYVNSNDDFTLKPWQLRFLEGYRNQCWSDDGEIRCLPTFYLAGFPKCGTSDLWVHLTRHRGVVRRYGRKEPDWWTRTRFYKGRWRDVPEDAFSSAKLSRNISSIIQTHKTSFTEYLANFFHQGNPEILVGDGSTSTIWRSYIMRIAMNFSSWSRNPSQDLLKALENYDLPPMHLIHQYSPQAKYIVMLREPVDRAYSNYLYNSRQLNYTPTQADFHQKVVETIRLYRDCLITGKNIRYCTCVKTLKHFREHRLSGVVKLGLYIVYIDHVLTMIPRENVLFLHFDDYRRDRIQVLKRTFRFLDVSHDDQTISEVVKDDETIINSSARLGTDIGPMWNKTRKILTPFYRPFNEELARLLNDEKWLFRRDDHAEQSSLQK